MDWISAFSAEGPAAKLAVALDKSAYSAGELVRGRVTLAVFREMTGDKLVVRVRGEERISWVEFVSEGGGGGSHHKKSHQKRKERTKSNLFLNDEVLVFAFPRAFTVGNYEFPFAYQSHASLPGVFAMDQQHHHHHPHKKNIRDLHATIAYSVHATLDEGYWFDCWNAHAKCILVLHEQPKIGLQYGDSSYNGSFDVTSRPVQLFSLLDQGKCELSASLSKSVYHSEESAKLQYHIKNASLMHIRALKVTLYQDLYLEMRKRRNCSEPISRKVAKLELAGVASESELNDFVSLALRSEDGRELSPSTNGALIKCRYRVHVQCDIRWCPDPFIDLPVVITAAVAISKTEGDAR